MVRRACEDCRPCWSQGLTRLRAKLPRRGLVKIYLLVFLIMFSNSFTITMLFPYLPFMMEFLIPRLQEDQKDVGKYIGYVAGSLFIGRVFGSYFWGVISDRKGRKPVLIISSVLVALFTLMFGFSVNFAMAVAARFLVGLANGMVSTSKAIVSEVSDDGNQAFGVSMVATAWASGYILGPAVSGAVADPINQYNLTISNPFLHNFLTKFPFSLPPIVSFLLFILTTILTILFLPETRGLKRSRKRSEINEMELAAIRSRLGVSNGVDQSQDSAQTSLCEEEEGTDETRLLGGEESDDSESRTSNLFFSNPATTNGNGMVSVDLSSATADGERWEGEERGRAAGEREEGEEKQDEEEREKGAMEQSTEVKGVQMEAASSMRSRRSRCASAVLSTVKNSLLDLKLFLCASTPLKCLLIYCVYSFGVIGFNELFSLWAYTQPHYGGLGFSLHEIGICLTIVGGLLMPVNLLAFPLLEKRLHAIKTYYLVAITVTVLILVLPNVHYLVSHKAALWVVLVSLSSILNGATAVGFSAIFMFINNSVTLDKLGSINGVAVMMTSITRAVAPVIAGSVFSASLSDATLAFGFPVNYNLVFVVFSIVFMVTVFMVACLPVSINKQKIIEDL